MPRADSRLPKCLSLAALLPCLGSRQGQQQHHLRLAWARRPEAPALVGEILPALKPHGRWGKQGGAKAEGAGPGSLVAWECECVFTVAFREQIQVGNLLSIAYVHAGLFKYTYIQFRYAIDSLSH